MGSAGHRDLCAGAEPAGEAGSTVTERWSPAKGNSLATRCLGGPPGGHDDVSLQAPDTHWSVKAEPSRAITSLPGPEAEVLRLGQQPGQGR